MKLRLAREGDLPELIALWKAVFGDGEGFIRAFYKASGIERTIIAQTNGRIVGMINCPEIELWANGARYCGAYIYALAVDVRYRSAGIGSALLRAAESGDYLGNAVQFLLLIPAEESLFDFYAKKGYDRPAFAPLIGTDTAEIQGDVPLSHDSEVLYDRYITACKQEAANGAVFVKPRAVFALSMGGTDCYAALDGYAALDKAQALIEHRPATPDLARKTALWKALAPIPNEISPLISRFMED